MRVALETIGGRLRREEIEADWEEAEGLILWSHRGVVPEGEVRWVVDTRKMTLVNQLRDFVQLGRKETMALLQQYLKQAIVESAIAERGRERLGPEGQALIEQEAQRALKRVPWRQMETRLFDQGAWVHKDPGQKVMVVILKPFGNPLMQRACELLCEHLNYLQSVMRCQDGNYALHYTLLPNPPP